MTKKAKNAAEVYLSKWSEDSESYKTMRSALNQIASVLEDGASVDTYPWHELRYEDVRAIPAKLVSKRTKKPLKTRTVNKALSALRGVLEAAWRSGTIPDEEYRRIKIENKRGNSEQAGHSLSDEEIEALLRAIKQAKPQDAALIALLYACGLRRVEAVRMKKEDYDPANGRVRAFGKGDKSRTVVLAVGWRPIVEIWWQTRPSRSFLFVDAEDQPLTKRMVSYAVKRLCAAAGSTRFTPHDLRRSFATHFLDNGGDIASLSRLLGHASIQTTMGYDRRDDEAANKIVAKLPSPGGTGDLK